MIYALASYLVHTWYADAKSKENIYPFCDHRCWAFVNPCSVVRQKTSFLLRGIKLVLAPMITAFELLSNLATSSFQTLMASFSFSFLLVL